VTRDRGQDQPCGPLLTKQRDSHGEEHEEVAGVIDVGPGSCFVLPTIAGLISRLFCALPSSKTAPSSDWTALDTMATPGRASPDNSVAEAAPWFRVPAKSVVSVEHPCIVKSVDKAISMLGGPTAIAETVQNDMERTLSLNFHPEDVASRNIISFNNSTNNVLLKVTIPKRTGRKRKRGSNNPFMEETNEPQPPKDASYFLRSLADNTESYDIEPVGSIQSTHVWRAMPDFVYSTHGSAFIDDLRSKILPLQYPRMKEWDLPRTYGLTNTESLPPPVLSTSSITQNYGYRQNPAVKQVTDSLTGRKILHNTQAPVKIFTHQCQYDSPAYPTTTPADCPPLNSQPLNLQSLARDIAVLFETRPIWTRRALINQLPKSSPLFLVRYAIAYVAFAIRSGPWRDTYCALGQDPRSSPSYRKYQTILLQLVPKMTKGSGQGQEDARAEFHRKWSRSRDTKSHIFTGADRIPEDGKVWQLCDLTDPQLKRLVDIPDRYLRATCDLRYFGWYANGTGSKMRVILKAKVEDLTENDGVARDPSVYEGFLSLPEEWDGPIRNEHGQVIEDVVGGYLPKDAGKRELEWASAYRSMCRAPPGSLPIGAYRLSKSKPETRASYVDVGSQSVERAATELLEEIGGGDGSPDVEREDTMAGYEEPEEGEGDELGQDLDADGEGEMEIDEEGNLQQAITASEEVEYGEDGGGDG
jgi:general transcription factor 3C polypeptide 5 (transcription factor C subunit 1)